MKRLVISLLATALVLSNSPKTTSEPDICVTSNEAEVTELSGTTIPGHDIEPELYICKDYTINSTVVGERVEVFGLDDIFDRFEIDRVFFNTMCWDYEVDGYFALATMILEVGWNANSRAWRVQNNPAGITGANGYFTYESKEAGVESMFRNLKRYGDDWGRYSVDQIRSRWSEASDSQMVVDIMNKLVKESKDGLLQ